MHRRRQLLAAAAAFAAVASVAPVAASAAPAKVSGPKCFGKKPTIVATGSHKTVKGTKKNDVIDALGTGDTVLGLGGNDLICVGNAKKVDAGDGNDKVQFASGTIIGGKGNDSLVQKGKTKGKTVVFGNDGNDTIALSKPNAIVDSGNGLDILTVPPQFLDSTTIVGGEGLIVNGISPRIDAPHGAPSAAIAYAGDPSPVVFARTVPPSEVAFRNSCCDEYTGVSFGNVIPKNGRFLSAWSVNFGDGFTQSGQGGLPNFLRHPYTTDGSHVITAIQTDSAGGITTRSITVNTSSAPTLSLGLATFPSTPGTASVPVTATAGSGAALTSWFADFGDGTFASGAAPVPNPITHTYASSDLSRTLRLTVTDDHGNYTTATRSITYTAGSATTTLALAASTPMTSFLANHENQGQQPAVPAANPTILFPNETLTLYETIDGPFPGGYSVDWGDGCYLDQPFNGVNQVGPCQNIDLYGVLSHSYEGPGARTITVRLHKDANPADDIVKTWSVNVVARQTVAELSRPGIVPQGNVVMSTAGTTVAAGAARWFFVAGDGSEEQFGDGAPPASFSHVYPSGVYYPRLYVYDHFGLSSSAYSFVDATSVRARMQYFGGEESDARWVSGIQSTDASGNDAVCFSGAFVPSVGARPAGAQIDFGDGTSQGAIRGFASGEFSCDDTVHGYTKTGEFTAIVAARDTAHQVATDREHVSIAGRPALAFPETMTVTASGPTATTIPASFGSAASNGANGNALAWAVDWNDPATPATNLQGGYGAIPTTLSHSYPNTGPGSTVHNVTVEILNDHGGDVTRTVAITVNGA